jgi:hypothetical protein
LSAGSFLATKIGPQKWTFFIPLNISAGSLLTGQKMELILAKLRHKISQEGFNIKFKMTLPLQETR